MHSEEEDDLEVHPQNDLSFVGDEDQATVQQFEKNLRLVEKHEKKLEVIQQKYPLRKSHFNDEMIEELAKIGVTIEKRGWAAIFNGAPTGSLLDSSILTEKELAETMTDQRITFSAFMTEEKKKHQDLIDQIVAIEAEDTEETLHKMLVKLNDIRGEELKKNSGRFNDTVYLTNWLTHLITFHRQRTNPLDKQNLEVWWDINLYGRLVDDCLIDLYTDYDWIRKEAVSTSAKSQRDRRIFKMDGILHHKRTKLEIAVLESEIPRDDTHIEQDRIKLAKTMRCMLDEAFEKGYYQALRDIPFIGIQTSDTFNIYILDRKYSDAYRFLQLYSSSFPTTPGVIMLAIELGIAMLTLKKHYFQKFASRIVEMYMKREEMKVIQELIPQYYQQGHVKMPDTPAKTSKGRSNKNLKGVTDQMYLNETDRSLVYSGIRELDNSKIVLKIPKSDSPSNIDELRVLIRLQSLKNGSHIVPLLDAIPMDNDDDDVGKSHFTLVFPLLDEIPWRSPLCMSTVKDWFGQLLSALDCLDSLHIVHLDVRPDNIMLNSSLNSLQLIDFDLAMIVTKDQPMISEMRGTMGYMSNEMMDGNGCISHKCDIFSAGIVLAVMVEHHISSTPELRDILLRYRRKSSAYFFGEPDNPIELVWNLCSELRRWCSQNKNNAHYSLPLHQAIHLISCMTQRDYRNRPTAKQALQHPFFRDSEHQSRKKIQVQAKPLINCNVEDAPKIMSF